MVGIFAHAYTHTHTNTVYDWHVTDQATNDWSEVPGKSEEPVQPVSDTGPHILRNFVTTDSKSKNETNNEYHLLGVCAMLYYAKHFIDIISKISLTVPILSRGKWG